MKRRFCALLAVLLLLTACGKTAEAAWQEQYDLGVKYLSEGNYEEAIIAFTAAIDIDPKRYEAYIGRGDAYLGVGAAEDLGKALSDYQTAEELAEEAGRLELSLRIALGHFRQGAYEQSDAVVENCSQIDSAATKAYIQSLWAQLAESGEIAAAKALYQAASCRGYVEDLLSAELAALFPYAIAEEAQVGTLPYLQMDIHTLGTYQGELSRVERHEGETTGGPYWECGGYLGKERAYLTQDVGSDFVNYVHVEYFPDNEPGKPFWLSAWGLEGGDRYGTVLEKMEFPEKWMEFFLEADDIRLYIAQNYANVSVEFDRYDRNEKSIDIMWNAGEEMVSWSLTIEPFSGYEDDVDSFLQEIYLSHYLNKAEA